MRAEFFSRSAIFNDASRTASLIGRSDQVREIIMVLIAKETDHVQE
jgi:hypothetical protein